MVSRRQLGWGVPWPETDPDGGRSVVYVWLDALCSYWSATQPARDASTPEDGTTAARDASEASRPTWPPQLQIVGKDISRFHALLWPALLLAAGLALPERLHVHGFVESRAGRYSQSAAPAPSAHEPRGAAPGTLTPARALTLLGPEAVRHTLLALVPYDADGPYDADLAIERWTTDGAHTIGNLVGRTAGLRRRHAPEGVPAVPTPGVDPELDADAREGLDPAGWIARAGPPLIPPPVRRAEADEAPGAAGR